MTPIGNYIILTPYESALTRYTYRWLVHYKKISRDHFRSSRIIRSRADLILLKRTHFNWQSFCFAILINFCHMKKSEFHWHYRVSNGHPSWTAMIRPERPGWWVNQDRSRFMYRVFFERDSISSSKSHSWNSKLHKYSHKGLKTTQKLLLVSIMDLLTVSNWSPKASDRSRSPRTKWTVRGGLVRSEYSTRKERSVLDV